jgi:hypothetical protein
LLTAEPYVGKYFSQDYVRRKFFAKLMKKLLSKIIIKKEIEDGIIPDPNAPMIQKLVPLTFLDLGQPVMEPDLVKFHQPEIQISISEIPKGGEI